MAQHKCSGHLPIPDMFRLAEESLTPSKFLKLKGEKLIYPLCLFEKAHKQKGGMEDFMDHCPKMMINLILELLLITSFQLNQDLCQG